MTASFSDDQWAAIDSRILAGNILQALLLIREYAGVGLNAAKDIHWERYQCLWAERPVDFACTDEEYWEGVYD
jgi:hypothetical protein